MGVGAIDNRSKSESVYTALTRARNTAVVISSSEVLPFPADVDLQNLNKNNLPAFQGLGMSIPEFMRTLSADERAELRRLREEGKIKTKCN